MDKGGRIQRALEDSDPQERNKNGRTTSGLYKIFSGLRSLRGLLRQVRQTNHRDSGTGGGDAGRGNRRDSAREFLKNERDALKHDAREMNEIVRQFPFTTDEAFRDSVEGSLFNIGKIYEQIDHNENMYPDLCPWQLHMEGRCKDTVVLFPPQGRWFVSWMPPLDLESKGNRGKLVPNKLIGCGGVDSYDIDATTDGRVQGNPCHIYNKFNMRAPQRLLQASPTLLWQKSSTRMC